MYPKLQAKPMYTFQQQTLTPPCSPCFPHSQPALKPAYLLFRTNAAARRSVAVDAGVADAPQRSSLKSLLQDARPLSDLPAPVDSSECPQLLTPDFATGANLPLSGCEPERAPLKIALLLSGGVDSSLALKLLLAAGHDVSAFYLQIWFQEDFRNYWDACPWEEDLAICQEVCREAGVPLEVVPLTEQYWQRVVSYCLNEIRAGRTPNPDILCNSRVKFGAFYQHLERHFGGQFDRIGSGHYARLVRGPEGDPGNQVRLAMTPDAVKDQTYFLAHLSQEQLSRTIFPLGTLTKAEVRQLAAAAALPNQARRDSQGICFLGKVRFSEFVREHLGTWHGAFLEQETGKIVGYHEGFWFYTLGQRKGIPLSGGPWYVSKKDLDSNIVYVSRAYYDEGKQRNSFQCSSFNWLGDDRPTDSSPLFCKVRHGPSMYRCQMRMLDADVAQVVLDGNDQGLASGQYVCLYQEGVCLGSAVITGSG